MNSEKNTADFIQWRKTCYTNLFSSVENAGYTTGWFEVLQGVRQGCPLSILLFILVVEILAIKVRNKTEIQGKIIGDRENKIFQFADDTTCFLRTEDSIAAILRTINVFFEIFRLTP